MKKNSANKSTGNFQVDSGPKFAFYTYPSPFYSSLSGLGPAPGPAPVTKAGHWSVFIIYPASLAQGLPATYEAFELFKSTKVRLDRFYMILTEL